jgi:hypothetical protein
MKACSRCGEVKLLSEFYHHKNHRDGHQSACKKCIKKQNCASKDSNAYLRHKQRLNSKYKNDDLFRTSRIAQAINWQKNNKTANKEIRRRRQRKERMTPKGKISRNISSSICISLKGKKNGSYWNKLTGFTVEQLVNHLEKQFRNGMSWNNYGSYWHIDHKIPIAAFNYETTDDIDFKRCWSLDNLQPLEASINVRKQDKVVRPFQPSLAISL